MMANVHNNGSAVGRFLGNRLDTCIDRGVFGPGFLRPAGYQSPPRHNHFTSAVRVTDDRNIPGGGDVISRLQLLYREAGQLEDLCGLRNGGV